MAPRDRDEDRCTSGRDRNKEKKKITDRERKHRYRDEDRERKHKVRDEDHERKHRDRDDEERRRRDRDEDDRKRKRRDDEQARESGRSERKKHRERYDADVEKHMEVDEEKDYEEKKRRNEEETKSVSKKTIASQQDDLEEDQRKLDVEAEKRRRRVQEWQELRLKKEEQEMQKRGDTTADQLNSGKAWTLEGEESDEEDVNGGREDFLLNKENVGDVTMTDHGVELNGVVMEEMAVNFNGDGSQTVRTEEEIDPLDAFMNSMVMPEIEKLYAQEALKVETSAPAKEFVESKSEAAVSNGSSSVKTVSRNMTGRIFPDEDSDYDGGSDEVEEEEEEEDEDDVEFIKRVKKTKAEKLALVDHSKIEYMPFRKNFYTEVKEITRMTPEEVSAYRKELEFRITGKDVPRPVKSWNQTGLATKVLDIIKKMGFEKPMPIQAQALPMIMSGRDCIGIAQTGSGKTLAFVLPMLRHIKDQPSLASGDGPIGLIVAPTRELVQQIYSDIKKFSKALGLTAVPVYGGSGVAQQISDLKRGAEIVVCTPGRMIDILCTSAGKITNLRRVTYLVLDEADRMFDMGFEPQITRILQNTRPDRQTVLFSATFPRQVEVLARKVLTRPVEIQVGGRSVVNKDIMQSVEVRPDGERFLRLRELLGKWLEKGKVLVFVHSQDKCDSLFRDLMKSRYPCLSLHGAKDQTDRESTISDFKSNVCNLLVATSVAARGLDVKDLELVVNFDVPNHYEDYVHRVGRTGRAGRKGCAVTFISPEEARYAPDLVKALELSEQPVPEDLKQLADEFMTKVNQGTEQAHGSGYGGSGFKFNEEEEEAMRAAKKAQAKVYGFEEEEDKSDSESDDDGIRKAGGVLAQVAAAAAAAAAMAKAVGQQQQPLLSMGQVVPRFSLPGAQPGGITGAPPGIAGSLGSSKSFDTLISSRKTRNQSNLNPEMSAGIVPSIPGLGFPGLGVGAVAPVTNEAAAKAAAFAAAINLQHNLSKIQAGAISEHYEAELEINDFPQRARWKVTHKDFLGPISEWTEAAITTRGQYFPPSKVPGPGERKLYLFIEGSTENSVKKAKAEIKRLLEECTAAALALPGGGRPGKYSVL